MEINQYFELSRRNSELIERLGMINDPTIQLEMCSICRDKDGNMLTNCGHSFCIECLMEWYIINMRNITCPNCRQNIEFDRCRYNVTFRQTHTDYSLFINPYTHRATIFHFIREREDTASQSSPSAQLYPPASSCRYSAFNGGFTGSVGMRGSRWSDTNRGRDVSFS